MRKVVRRMRVSPTSWGNLRRINTEGVPTPPTFSRERRRVRAARCRVPVGGAAWPAARCRENSDPIRAVFDRNPQPSLASHPFSALDFNSRGVVSLLSMPDDLAALPAPLTQLWSHVAGAFNGAIATATTIDSVEEYLNPLQAYKLERCEGKQCMSVAEVDARYCLGESDESSTGCYLLSQTSLLGARLSLDLLNLKPPPGSTSPENLPSFDRWGFLHPSCWSYARRRRRPGRKAILEPADDRLRRMALEAAQEWVHPEADARLRRSLRVVIAGRCLPLLLDGLPQRLTRGTLRREGLITTLIDGSQQRRALVMRSIVVDPIAAPTLAEARARYPGLINPIVTADEDSDDSVADGAPNVVAQLRAEARLRRKLTAWRLIGINVAVHSRGSHSAAQKAHHNLGHRCSLTVVRMMHCRCSSSTPSSPHAECSSGTCCSGCRWWTGSIRRSHTWASRCM